MVRKIGFLVLAHASPRVLEQFVSRFAGDRFAFYVHLDAKADLQSYAPDGDLRRATFLDRRVDVFWGGFNMVRATLELCRSALQDPELTHACLVSDDSFPVVSPDRFHEEVGRCGVRLNAWRLSVEQSERYTRFYRFDSHHASARHIPAERRCLTMEDLLAYGAIRDLMQRGKKPLQLYGGSQWWLLPRGILQAILDQAESDAWLMDSFACSAIPDEHFFQTLTMTLLPELRQSSNSPMYVDFGRDPKPFVFSHRHQVEGLDLADKLLIRKVACDPDLLDRLARAGER